MLEISLLSLYTLAMALLGLYTLLQLHLTKLYRQFHKSHKLSEPYTHCIEEREWQFVTVQLPIYNEMYVADRVLDYVAAIDYPKNRLEVQVLDDSTDATRQILDQKVSDLQRLGYPVYLVRRANREGYKAGALREGMKRANGQFIAIFDADFLPRKDFLKTTMPWFDDKKLAVVQARWGFINESQTLLTRIQAFFLNAHFTVEQTGRSRNELFANFNGTAGVWRREAIEDAGGWRHETLTEDTDLSYRAQLRGWRIHYLEDYDVPSELPVDLRGFRLQQFRWMKGGAENARIHLKSILRSHLPIRSKFHAASHLLSTSVYVVILLAMFLSVPLSFFKNTYIATDYVHYGMLFFISTVALCIVYYHACGEKVTTLRGKIEFLYLMVLFLIFTMGLALHNGIAVLRGWFGEKTEFCRTPKYGRLAKPGSWVITAYADNVLRPIVFVEIALFVYLGIGVIRGVNTLEYGFIPIQVLAMSGLVWNIGLGLREQYNLIRIVRQGFVGDKTDLSLSNHISNSPKKGTLQQAKTK